MPVADLSLPSGLRPPPEPLSELSAAASWIASVAERLVTLVPKNSRASTSSCGKVGVEVKVWTGPVPQYLAQSSAGAFDLAYGNLSRADGDVLRTQFLNTLPSNTVKGYTDPTLRQLLLGQLATADQAKRNEIAQQAGERIIELGYYIPVVELTTVLGTAANVHGIVLGGDSRLGSLVDAYKTK